MAEMPSINMADDLWAWVTEYPDGSIGLIGYTYIREGVMVPLIGRNEKAVRMMEQPAREHGAAFNQRIWLRRYTKAEDYI